MSTIAAPATIEDLARYPGKAELINGRIVKHMATGFRPNRLAAFIWQMIEEYAMACGRGYGLTDNMGFRVRRLSSGRESFSPDAAYYSGNPPKNDMKFISGPPTLAVEVRSENDYGDMAEEEMASKRADYFEAGTLTVWDVDPLANTITVYRVGEPEQGQVFGMSDTVDAEPAMPGWKVAVNEIMKR